VTIAKNSSGDGTAIVMFRLPAAAAAHAVQLVGEFNDWEPLEMKIADDGSHELTLVLETGRSYRFRYVVDGERWENDWAADDYVTNEYGGEDSVIDLRTIPPAR